RVWVTSTCDPIDHLRELEDLHQNSNGSSITNGTSTIDFDRWNRLFQSFHKEVIGVSNQSMPGWLQRLESTFDRGKIAAGARKTIRDECAVSPQLQSVAERIVKRLPDRPGWSDRDLLNEIGYSAEPYYRALWLSCLTKEKLMLKQLADEGLVNPRDEATVLELMRKGLVVRNNGFKLINKTFRRFVAHAVSADTVAEWEREGVRIPWTSIRTALATCAIAFGGFLILTQQQLVGAWFGVVPTLIPAVVVPAAPTLINLLAGRILKR